MPRLCRGALATCALPAPLASAALRARSSRQPRTLDPRRDGVRHRHCQDGLLLAAPLLAVQLSLDHLGAHAADPRGCEPAGRWCVCVATWLHTRHGTTAVTSHECEQATGHTQRGVSLLMVVWLEAVGRLHDAGGGVVHEVGTLGVTCARVW